MTRFNCHNRRCRGENRGVGDQVSRSEIRGHTDVLDGTGDRRHGGDARQRAREVELAPRNSAGTEGLERVLQQILSFREFTVCRD